MKKKELMSIDEFTAFLGDIKEHFFKPEGLDLTFEETDDGEYKVHFIKPGHPEPSRKFSILFRPGEISEGGDFIGLKYKIIW